MKVQTIIEVNELNYRIIYQMDFVPTAYSLQPSASFINH